MELQYVSWPKHNLVSLQSTKSEDFKESLGDHGKHWKVQLQTSMLGLLTVGSKFTRPARHTAAAAIDQYLLRAHARPQQQTCPPPLLLSIDGMACGRMLNRFMMLIMCYAYRVITRGSWNSGRCDSSCWGQTALSAVCDPMHQQCGMNRDQGDFQNYNHRAFNITYH